MSELVDDLKRATDLKEQGTIQVFETRYTLGACKYESALNILEAYNLGSTGRECPSEDEEYRALWTRALEEHAKLQLSCFLNIALCRLKTEEWMKVTDAATEALRIDERNPKALFRRGTAYLRRSQEPGGNGLWLEEAKADLLAAAKIEPKNKDIRVELEAATTALKQQRALQLEKASAGDSHKEVRNGFAKGVLYSDADDNSEARMKRLIQEAGKAVASGKYVDALGIYKRAIEAAALCKPGPEPMLEIRNGAGECSMALENYERAFTEFEACAEYAAELAAHQAKANAWEKAAKAMTLMGKIAESKSAHEKCLAAATKCGDERLQQVSNDGIQAASDPQNIAISSSATVQSINEKLEALRGDIDNLDEG
ncbi:hypothetical protein CYMTET_56350 [Cymbomonas tetramitiformis]|uniref:Uncharacterized protein n=1 Tax=Cymbomonas tetramitiformis TaxID=36881 RepID=A0AAE0BCI1_9CHLO|nr:hypothetical protein CYMTET_56350 [Cymbomonas tetramitiformis]